MPTLNNVKKAVRKFQPLLAPDWCIDEIRVCPIDPSTDAQVLFNALNKCAIITVANDANDDELDFLVCHELMHLVMVEMNTITNTALEQYTAPATGLYISKLLSAAEETICNKAAYTIACANVRSQPAVCAKKKDLKIGFINE